MTDPAVADALLEIEGLVVRRHGDTLLDQVAMRVGRGSIHVLVGPNGAGKSTLVATILNQIPFVGRIEVNWAATGAVGYVPQMFAVDPTLPVTVGDFLALTRQRRPVCLGLTRSSRAAAARLLDRVGLSGLERRPLAVLSGGELRRVLLAHALEPEPELLVLDEPGAGLDETALRTLEDTLRQLRRTGRTTILMVSHDLEQVQRIADRVTVLDRRVVADGPPGVLSSAHVRELIPPPERRRAVRA
jgi:zinc transport system ATP-binding protein